MEYIYAALLLHKLGKHVDSEHLHKVIAAAGEEPDESKIKSLVASLKGIDIAKSLSLRLWFQLHQRRQQHQKQRKKKSLRKKRKLLRLKD